MMHAKAVARYHREIIAALGDPAALDRALDLYADSLYRATEWDADQWGFDPDRWMAAERSELAARGGAEYPREAI